MRPALLLVVTLFAGSSFAEPRPARDTADVGPPGSWSVGVFDPLRYGLADRVELQAHPLLFFVAPHLDVRAALVKSPAPAGTAPTGARLAGEVGLMFPTLAMRLTKGYLFPSWSTSSNDIGYMLIPRAAVVSSVNFFTHDVLTGRLEAQARILLGPNSATPLNSFLAPLELLLAAPLTGFLGRAGFTYDHAFGEWLRLRADVDFYLTGPQGHVVVSGTDMGPRPQLSPFIFTARLGLDIAVFAQSRVVVGGYFANYDQGATALHTRADGFSERVRVRSNNILPTIDFIWSGF